MSQKLSKRKLAKIYRLTAKAFEDGEFEWAKGAMGTFTEDAKATHCAVGGLHHTAHKLGLVKVYDPWSDELTNVVRDKKTERRVSKALGVGYAAAIGYNDDDGTDKEDVIKYLRKVARALEHGGKVV